MTAKSNRCAFHYRRQMGIIKLANFMFMSSFFSLTAFASSPDGNSTGAKPAWEAYHSELERRIELEVEQARNEAKTRHTMESQQTRLYSLAARIRSYLPKAGGPTEVYNFQLIDDLPEGVYDYLWLRLHPSSYYPEIKR